MKQRTKNPTNPTDFKLVDRFIFGLQQKDQLPDESHRLQRLCQNSHYARGSAAFRAESLWLSVVAL